MAELGVSLVPIRKTSVQIEGPGTETFPLSQALPGSKCPTNGRRRPATPHFSARSPFVSPLWKIRAAALSRERPSSMRLEMPESP